MSILPSDSSVALPFPAAASDAIQAKPSAIAEEVLVLFEELRNPLLRYLLGFGLSIHNAEEVTQEVFLALFQHLQRGRSRANLRGWIFRVGHNLALKQRMRDARTNRLHADASAADQHAAIDPDPEEHLKRAQRQQHLQGVVRELPELDRCCLHLRAEGLRYREIAEALGISLGGVSLSLARSMARLIRADMQGEEEHDEKY